MKRESRAPLMVAVVLLLLLLYVGSYSALVIPGGEIIVPSSVTLPFPHPVTRTYKLGGTSAETLFWPLEQVDRRVRPWKWSRDLPVLDGWKDGIPLQ